ncbi:MAG: hypothetical protein M1820_005496 [Bogoriella megaspora]|nr:MAG: hypothetical protein M1820_005496 [Bogoriella megaspora]
MSPTRKILIGAIFALGWFVVGAGIARTVAGIRAFATVTTDFDYTYSRVSVFYWTVIEVCVGVISSCLPTMRPLLFHYLGDHPVSSIRSALGMRSRNSDDTLVSTGPQAAAKDSFELSLVPERPQRLNSSIVEKTSTNSLPRPAEAIAVQRDFDFISNRV